MDKEFYAHIRQNEDGPVFQTVSEHCFNTANIAAECLYNTAMESSAFLAGCLHDMGKCKEEFQTYLLKVFKGENVTRGSVIHTFAGVRYILENYWNGEEASLESITAEVIAYAIGAHHSLFDIGGDGHENGFAHRIAAKDIGYEESRTNYNEDVLSSEQIDNFMEKAANDLGSVIERIIAVTDSTCSEDDNRYNEELFFYLGILIRLILSAVIEGDRTDTAKFMLGEVSIREKFSWESISNGLEEKLAKFVNDTPIAISRKWISDKCDQSADLAPGIFRLNVPTGAGKTLSSLRFALKHAAVHNKKRIIFAVPLLSILEQNADVIKNYVGNDRLILEHHSNVVREKAGEEDGAQEALIENWEAPIIITTLVQLLNTMFAGKTSNIRRFHSLIDSIIVIDEVQTIPLQMYSMFELMVNFLCEFCGTTFVLCSATQPEFLETGHPFIREPRDMVPFNADIWKAFSRTEIVDGGKADLSEIPQRVVEMLRSTHSCLVVCNKKKEAQDLYSLIKEQGIRCFHLSAAMCTAHRRVILSDLYNALSEASLDAPVVCVSTQVIEAGVDISFGSVIRLSAGMDSVVQSAGRCNRNAEFDGRAPVSIVSLKNENLAHLQKIQNGQEATMNLLYDFKQHPEDYGNDLSSEEAIKHYYKLLYRQLSELSMDYSVKNPQCTLLDLLGQNSKFGSAAGQYSNKQAFKTAGQLFSVFDDNSIDAVVPYGEGEEIIQKLLACSPEDYASQRKLSQEAKLYTVTVYSYQQKRLEEEHGISWTCDNTIAILSPEYYSEETGFTEEKQELEFLEV